MLRYALNKIIHDMADDLIICNVLAEPNTHENRLKVLPEVLKKISASIKEDIKCDSP